MLDIIAYISDITCGDACWRARENVCHCSCGGKNHGILRSENGTQPTRQAKIDGIRYELRAIGYQRNLYDAANEINEAAGFYQILAPFHYTHRETEKGAAARIKPATKDQIARWAELSAYQNAPRYEIVALLWVKVEIPESKYCAVPCTKCDAHKAKYAQAMTA